MDVECVKREMEGGGKTHKFKVIHIDCMGVRLCSRCVLHNSLISSFQQ